MPEMATPEIKLATSRSVGSMDRKIRGNPWAPARWPVALKVAVAGVAVVLAALLVIEVRTRASARTVRMPLAQLTIATVEEGVFHDLVAVRANVVPRDTIYID